MDKQRAQEIASSPEMVNVTYRENPIYIQHVDENKETAIVYPLHAPENEKEVPLNSLIEH